jgi:hypothetical protein
MFKRYCLFGDRKAVYKAGSTAAWIEAAGTDPDAYGVYLFRKSFELPERPDQFIVHFSADNRYKLYVNEQLAPPFSTGKSR